MEYAQFKICLRCGQASVRQAQRCRCGFRFFSEAEGGSSDFSYLGAGEAIKTHYDTLKVARDAPPEVIRAAYRALSNTHHPDRNQGDLDTGQSMAAINAAYATLSDPALRAEHDGWIAAAEWSATHINTKVPPRSRQREEEKAKPKPAGNGNILGWLVYGTSIAVLTGLVSWALWNHLDRGPSVDAGSNAYLATAPAPSQPAAAVVTLPKAGSGGWPYLRPASAPNGMPWPDKSGYVDGYAQLRTDGGWTLTLDNTGVSGDVFVKLVALDGRRGRGIRAVLIKKGDQFEVDGLSAGTYEVWYLVLDSGVVRRSAPMVLDDVPMSLYSGAMHAVVLLSASQDSPGTSGARFSQF